MGQKMKKIKFEECFFTGRDIMKISENSTCLSVVGYSLAINGQVDNHNFENFS